MVWHLIWADICRHRLVLAMWTLLWIGAIVLAAVGPHLVLAPGASATLTLAGGPLRVALFLLSVILAPIVMQTHPFTGTTAFWMTRPIAPGLLLTAKLILLGAALVALPACALIVAMTASGVPRAPMLFGVVSLIVSQSAWLALTVAYAALTQTLARYLMAVGATLAALVAYLFLISAFEALQTPDSPGSQRWAPPTPTDDLVGPALVAVALVLVAVVQAFTRNRGASIVTGIAGMGVALTMWSHGHWNVLDPERRPPAWTASEQAGRLVAGPEDVRAERNVFATRSTRWRTIRARARLHDLPKAWTANVQLVMAALQLPDGTALSSPTLNSAAPPFAADAGNPMHETIKSALGVELLAQPFPTRGESLPAFIMPDDEFRRLAPTVARYTGRFDVHPTRYHVEARLPLRVGAAIANDTYRLELLDVRSGIDSVELTAVESNFDTPFGTMRPAQHRFYLTNARCRCAIEIGDRNIRDIAFGMVGIHMSNNSALQFLPRQRRLAYPTPQFPVQEAFEIDDTWIAGAELVILRTDIHPPFQRTLVIDDFPVRQPPPGEPSDVAPLEVDR
jgi:hypothetical protein